MQILRRNPCVAARICSKLKTMSTYITPKLSRLVYPNKDNVSSGSRWRAYSEKDARVTVIAFRLRQLPELQYLQTAPSWVWNGSPKK
jgi:hypothetical protein